MQSFLKNVCCCDSVFFHFSLFSFFGISCQKWHFSFNNKKMKWKCHYKSDKKHSNFLNWEGFIFLEIQFIFYSFEIGEYAKLSHRRAGRKEKKSRDKFHSSTYVRSQGICVMSTALHQLRDDEHELTCCNPFRLYVQLHGSQLLIWWPD